MRLVTRSDFDGLVCGALLKLFGIIDSWQYVHPKDLQDGKFEVTKNDVLANVPYVKGCGIWFDHHVSEKERLGEFKYKGESRIAPSCARIIYEYYDGPTKYPDLKEMLKGVDKVDSASLTIEEILIPTDWILLGFIMDPRTGLGRFRDFKISNYQLMEMLMDACTNMSIEEILELDDIKERIDVYFEQTRLFEKMILNNSAIVGDAILTDLRGIDTIYTGNRFLVYSLYPNQNISLWVVDGKQKQNCSIAVGYSVINKTSKVHVGNLMLKHGGGGHKQVGTCQVPYEDCDRTIKEICEAINNQE